MSKDSYIQTPALGRPFKLGTLYDCRSDTLLPGITLWDDSAIRNNLSSIANPSNNFQLITEDSLNEKASKMDISAELKLSFLGGLVEVSGSGRYLNDRKSSLRQSRVTLQYSCTTRHDTLTMEQLGPFKAQYENVFDTNDATHVVVAITYGADAFLIFNTTSSSAEDVSKIDGSLHIAVKSIPSFSVDAHASVSLDSKDKDLLDKINVTFYGDFHLQQNPTTFAESVAIYKDLPSLLGEHNERAVPKTVWLCPLGLIDTRGQKIVRAIESSLINGAVDIGEELLEAKLKIQALSEAGINKEFPHLKEKTDRMQKAVSEYEVLFKARLAKCLPNIRGGVSDRSIELVEIIQNHYKSPFAKVTLNSWQTSKAKEQQVLQNMALHLKRFSPFQAIEDQLDTDNQLCALEFLITGMQDLFVENAKKYVRGEVIDHESQNLPLPWFEDSTKLTQTKHRVRQFLEFANQESADTRFVVSQNILRDQDHPTRVVLIKDESEKIIELPGATGKPEVVSAASTTFELKWTPPQQGENQIQEYLCLYRLVIAVTADTDLSYERKWTEQTCLTTTVILKDLAPETSYECKVIGITTFGKTKESSVLGPIKTTKRSMKERSALKLLDTATVTDTGEPVTYQLKLELTYENKQNEIRKVTIGQKPPKPIPEKVILVMGASGAGKSTLINAMVNYVYNVKWDDSFRLKAIMEQDEADATRQTRSMTTGVTAYTFYPDLDANVNYALTIVDTPGFADTSGMERDKKTTNQLKQLFSTPGKHGLDTLTAVGFVVQSSTARLTAAQNYVFDCILSVFGKDIAENIFLLITFGDDKLPPVLAAVTQAGIPIQGHFVFNNSASFAKKAEESDFTELYWKMGLKSMNKFFTRLHHVSPKSLQLTKEVLQKRDQLGASVEALQMKIMAGLGHMDYVKQLIRTINQYSAEVDANINFQVDVQVPKIAKIDLQPGQYVTNCQFCNFTCHFPCAIADDSQKAGCAAMSNDHCKECPQKCHWSRHFNMPYRFEVSTVSETRTLDEIKARYNLALQNKGGSAALLKLAWAEYEDTNKHVLLLILDMKQNLEELARIALKPNPMSSVEYIDVLIESEKSAHKNGWEARVKSLQYAKETAELMQYVNNVDIAGLTEPGSQTLPDELDGQSGKERNYIQKLWDTLRGKAK